MRKCIPLSTVILTVCFSLLIIPFNACTDDDDEDEKIVFSGIVLTDEQGNAAGTLGEEDGDWTFDEAFSKKEKDLFSLKSISLLTKDDPVPISQPNAEINAYPNPTTSFITLSFPFPDETAETFKIILVDEDYNVYFRGEYSVQAGVYNFMISISDIDGIKPDIIYRFLYCTVDDNNNFYTMGHGDIILIKE
ncbi:MAG: hypothetical protein JXB49_22500 [Bacteroidales bacterium]|nr:hypothetical protein [Bacteroidales bacterium]